MVHLHKKQPKGEMEQKLRVNLIYPKMRAILSSAKNDDFDKSGAFLFCVSECG